MLNCLGLSIYRSALASPSGALIGCVAGGLGCSGFLKHVVHSRGAVCSSFPHGWIVDAAESARCLPFTEVGDAAQAPANWRVDRPSLLLFAVQSQAILVNSLAIV